MWHRAMKPRKTARDCALSLLEYGDRTEKEMRQKLKEREYLARDIEETLEFLKEYHYIDDAEYTERYIRACSSRKSIRQIRCDLERKGVDREVVDGRLAEAPVDEEAQICRFLAKKGCRPGEKMDPAEYRRITGALCRKGFSYDAIRRAAGRMQEEVWSD